MSGRARDRRSACRYGRSEDHGIVAARVRPGLEVTLVDVSAKGALLETTHRILPGGCVELQWRREGTWSELLRARVVRCWIARLDPAATYRAAVQFDRGIQCFPEETRCGYVVPGEEAPANRLLRAAATRPLP